MEYGGHNQTLAIVTRHQVQDIQEPLYLSMNWSKQERSKAKHVSRSRTVHNWRSEEHIHIAHHASPKQKSDTVDAIVAGHRGGASAGGPRQSAPAVAQGRTAGATSQAANTDWGLGARSKPQPLPSWRAMVSYHTAAATSANFSKTWALYAGLSKPGQKPNLVLCRPAANDADASHWKSTCLFEAVPPFFLIFRMKTIG